MEGKEAQLREHEKQRGKFGIVNEIEEQGDKVGSEQRDDCTERG